LSMFVGGMVFADDYDRYAPDVMDKDGVGPHGSAYGGPGYNVNIGDSLREMNQKTLAQRETYRAPAVADPCPIEPLLLNSGLTIVGMYGLCVARMEPMGFRVTWYPEMVQRDERRQFEWTMDPEKTDWNQFLRVMKGKLKVGKGMPHVYTASGARVNSTLQLLHKDPVVVVQPAAFLTDAIAYTFVALEKADAEHPTTRMLESIIYALRGDGTLPPEREL